MHFLTKKCSLSFLGVWGVQSDFRIRISLLSLTSTRAVAMAKTLPSQLTPSRSPSRSRSPSPKPEPGASQPAKRSRSPSPERRPRKQQRSGPMQTGASQPVKRSRSPSPERRPRKEQRSSPSEPQAFVHAEYMELVAKRLHTIEAELACTESKLADTESKLACTEDDLRITTGQLHSAKENHRDACNELTAVQDKLYATETELKIACAERFDFREKLNNEEFRNKHLEKALEEREAITKKQETALRDERKAHMALDQKIRDTVSDMKKQSVALYDDPVQILDVIKDVGIENESKLNAVLEGLLAFEDALDKMVTELFTVLTGKGTNKQKVIDAKDIAIRIGLLKGTLNPQ